jgi:hypothetical protein
MLMKGCAAWLVLLAVSPFTAPFSVCQPSDLAIADIGPRHTPSPRSGFEAWWVEAGVTSDLPMTAMADKVAAVSTARAGQLTARLDTATVVARPSIAPPRSASLPLVLRV